MCNLPKENLFKKRIFSPDFLIFFLNFYDVKRALLHICIWSKRDIEESEEYLDSLKIFLRGIPHNENMYDSANGHTFENDLNKIIAYLRKTVRDTKDKRKKEVTRKQKEENRKQLVGYY